VAFALACEGIDAPHYFAVYLTASAAILCAAVLQDTFRLAFRDELTGLPSRRALNERMMALGSNYTIAMLDVDHFKRFNDMYGHELGDQVLRMVAAKLARIGGGGRAYRYGEEFSCSGAAARCMAASGRAAQGDRPPSGGGAQRGPARANTRGLASSRGVAPVCDCVGRGEHRCGRAQRRPRHARGGAARRR
jgi:hypothetical protein